MHVTPIACAVLVVLLGCERSTGSPAANHTGSGSNAGSPAAAASNAGNAGAASQGSRVLRAPATPVDPPAAAGAMAPNVTPTRDGVIATWIEPVDAGKTGHRVRFASYASGRWTAATTITEAPSIMANWADTPSVVQQGNGTLVAHWAEQVAPAAHAYDVVLAKSGDAGRTWQPLGRAHADRSATEHGFVSLVPERDRTVAIWLDGRDTVRGGPTRLRTTLVAGADDKRFETIIDDRVCDCCGTNAAATDGGAIVVYRDRSADEIRDISIVRQTGGAWSAPAPVATDGWKIAGCPVNGPAVAAHGREVAVAWFTLAGGTPHVRIAFSADAGASFGPPIDVDVSEGTRAPVGRVDVELHGGDAVVTWLASEREAAVVLARRVARDGRRGREVELARTTSGRESGFPRLAPLPGDELLATWTETSEPKRVRAVRVPAAAVPKPERSAETTKPAPVAATLAVGAPAPDYHATSATGARVELKSLRGAPVLLNVWATWCEPCRHELPILDALRARHASRGLRVIAASVDRDEPADQVVAFMQRRKLGIELWLDREDRASTGFGIATLPATLLFDAKGTLVWRRDGVIADGDPDLAAALERVLSR